jgi:hypothetical protein
MKIKVSKIVPRGYAGITLWPFGIYFSKARYLTDARILNHEKIHWEQQKELGGLIFYILYLIEWVIKLFIHPGESYRNLGAEREAKHYEKTPNYLENRKRYVWLKYIFKEYAT